jgi:ribosome-binding factor A
MSRIEKVRSLLLQEISKIIQVKLGDSRVGFISLQDIKISKDLRNATILFSQIGNDHEKKRTLKALAGAAGFIKMELGKVLKIKTIPTLHFKFDPSIEKAAHLIEKINNEL